MSLKERIIEYLIKLNIGDWSGDGHDKKEEVLCKSNKDVLEVRKAYKKGTEIIGLDLFTICNEYEDDRITSEQRKLFRCLDDVDADSVDDNFVPIGVKEMCNMWLEIVRSGDQDLRIEELTSIQHFNGYWADDKYFNNHIGYGLFL